MPALAKPGSRRSSMDSVGSTILVPRPQRELEAQTGDDRSSGEEDTEPEDQGTRSNWIKQEETPSKFHDDGVSHCRHLQCKLSLPVLSSWVTGWLERYEAWQSHKATLEAALSSEWRLSRATKDADLSQTKSRVSTRWQ